VGRIIRRVRQAGVYFVTTDTWQKRVLFAKAETARIVLEQLLSCRERGFYKLHAFVVMPDHLHVLLTPGETTTLEKAIQMIKGGAAFRIRQEQHLQFPVWHAGFHDRWIRDVRKYQETKHYIEQNPVEAKLAERAADYAWSSADGRQPVDSSRFDRIGTGAKAPVVVPSNVAAEAATHRALANKAVLHDRDNQVRKPLFYQLSWKTLPGLRGMACSDFRATETTTPDHERGVAVEFSGPGERDAFLAELEAHFAAQRFSNNAVAFETVKAHILERVAQRPD
jgi:REP-associated tyrosine transposase